MHNNFHFFKKLVPVLQDEIQSMELLECYSQHKDELMLGFANQQTSFWIRADLSSEFSCLFFPKESHRAGKNTIDLFSVLIGKKVENVALFENERAFGISFENNFHLVFKLFGNRGNIILFEGNIATAIFKNKIQADLDLIRVSLNRSLEQNLTTDLTESDIKLLFPTWGKLPWRWLYQEGFAEVDSAGKIHLVKACLGLMENDEFFVTRLNGEVFLSLLPLGDDFRVFTDPVEAINAFFITHVREHYLEREKNKLIAKYQKEIRDAKKYIEKSYHRLEQLEEGASNEEIGHIIMANLHQLKSGVSSVILHDFYRNTDIEVKLKKHLSPQKNAESYYRKGKNEKIEIAKIVENIAHRESSIEKLSNQLEEVSAIEDAKTLKKYLKSTDSASTKKEKSNFLEFELQGFKILIGRNARNNDELTLKTAKKDDLWLHAKDVSGSHVVIRQIPGQNYPQNVIEQAASWAAFFSKRKTDSLCPVIVTSKKFVRKVKGSPAGAVVVEKEKVVLVPPSDPR